MCLSPVFIYFPLPLLLLHLLLKSTHQLHVLENRTLMTFCFTSTDVTANKVSVDPHRSSHITKRFLGHLCAVTADTHTHYNFVNYQTTMAHCCSHCFLLLLLAAPPAASSPRPPLAVQSPVFPPLPSMIFWVMLLNLSLSSWRSHDGAPFHHCARCSFSSRVSHPINKIKRIKKKKDRDCR